MAYDIYSRLSYNRAPISPTIGFTRRPEVLVADACCVSFESGTEYDLRDLPLVSSGVSSINREQLRRTTRALPHGESEADGAQIAEQF